MRTLSPARYTALLVCLSLGTPPSWAAAVDELITTAQKREESLQEVPIAISALSSEGLEKANIKSIDDLSNAISGINVQNQNGYMTPIVRGAGTITPGSAFYQAVATYIDDMYFTRSYSTNLSIEAAESVQLLKGPQGALYGRNATAGAIIIRTKQPEPGGDLEGNVKLSYAEFDQKTASARIAGGLGDQVGASLEGYWSENDGYFDILPASQNAQDDEFGNIDEWQISGKLVFQPTDNINIKVKATHAEWERRWNSWDNVADQEFLSAAQITQINPLLAPGALEAIVGNPGLNADAYVAAGLNSSQVLLATIMGGDLMFPAANAIGLASMIDNSRGFGNAHENLINSCELGNFSGLGVECSGGNFSNVEDTSVVLTATFNLERFDLVSITSYRDGAQASAAGVADIDASSPGAAALLGALAPAGITNLGLGFSGEFETDDIQQEFRFVSNDSWDWQWIAGVHYFEESSDTHRIDGNSFGGLARNVNAAWENKSISAFAQLTYPFTDQWNVTLGSRYISDDYELTDNLDFSSPLPIVPAVAAIGPLGTIDDEQNFTTFLARLEYQADAWLGYASVSSGFKSGSLNNDGPAFGRAEPEDILAYELGFKSQWLDDQLRVNGAVFYYDYTNPHITFVDNATGGQVLLNIPEADIFGVELDLTGVAGDNLNWYINMTALDTEYKADALFNNAAVGLTSVLASNGKDMGAAPPFQASAGLDYRVPIGDSFELAITPTINFNSGVWYDAENRVGSGGASDDSYTVANLNLRFTPNDGNWSATLWAKNLFDEEYYRGGVVANGFFLIAMPGDPQQIGATLNFDFGQ